MSYDEKQLKPSASQADAPGPAVPGKRTLTESCSTPVPALSVQMRAGRAAHDEEGVHTAASQGVATPATSLPHYSLIQRAFGRRDLSGVKAHTGPEAGATARAMGTDAYATGDHVILGDRTDLHTVAHEAAHVVQQRAGVQLQGGVGEAGDVYERHADAVADRVVAGHSAEGLLSEMAGGSSAATSGGSVQRKEVASRAAITGVQDWTHDDRETESARWQSACLHNLHAVDSSQYVKVVERRDFYKWFYNYAASLKFETRWALAAYVVANGAHQIADMDDVHAFANDSLGMANVELQGAMREGNQVIFDNVLPKLKRLIDGRPLKGKAALEWDMQVLSEEQSLIQPMYARMSPQTREQLNYIARKKRIAGLGATVTGDDKVASGPNNNAGRVPAFDQPDLQNVDDRWRYGMGLGNQFTPGGTGFDPAVHARPPVPSGYADGSEFAKVDKRQHLHELDAWLNPHRISRVGSGGDLSPIINGLTDLEKAVVLGDKSADGWAYSTQFAQFSFITAVEVRKALPPQPAEAISGFLARYTAERQRVEAETRKWMEPPRSKL